MYMDKEIDFGTDSSPWEALAAFVEYGTEGAEPEYG